MARPSLLEPIDSILVQALESANFEAARWAIEKGANPNYCKNMPLRKAIEAQDLELLSYLIIDKGVPVHDEILERAGMHLCL